VKINILNGSSPTTIAPDQNPIWPVMQVGHSPKGLRTQEGQAHAFDAKYFGQKSRI
jgi:hypothetical protein